MRYNNTVAPPVPAKAAEFARAAECAPCAPRIITPRRSIWIAICNSGGGGTQCLRLVSDERGASSPRTAPRHCRHRRRHTITRQSEIRKRADSTFQRGLFGFRSNFGYEHAVVKSDGTAQGGIASRN